jgi:hypothetical protein
MIIQVQDVLKDALALSGVIAMDETPTTSEYAVLLRVANVMIDRWSTQRLLLRSTHPTSFTINAGTPTYTIGPSGATVTAAKPISVRSAYIRDSSNLDTTLDIIPVETYNSLSDKTDSTGQPMYLAYDPGDAQQTTNIGTISVYYNPDKSYTLFMEVDAYLNEFVNLTDTVSFEPAYYEALIYNIAVRSFRFFRDASVPVPIEIISIANNSLNNLRTMNSVQITAGMDLPGKTSTYNIYTDGYN